MKKLIKFSKSSKLEKKQIAFFANEKQQAKLKKIVKLNKFKSISEAVRACIEAY